MVNNYFVKTVFETKMSVAVQTPYILQVKSTLKLLFFKQYLYNI